MVADATGAGRAIGPGDLPTGDVRGKQMRGDNKVMDVAVTGITDKGSKLLGE